MEFSKTYRQAICNDLLTLFQYNNTTDDRGQITYFMSGEVPDHDTLHAYIRDEWYGPSDAIVKAPDHASASIHGQYVGKNANFLNRFVWETVTERQSLASKFDDTVDADTVTLAQVVAVNGLYNELTNPTLSGFTHADKGDTAITWALTLWGSPTSLPQYRNWYVMHRVGTVLDPLAEIVMTDNIVRSDNPEVRVGQLYSPIF